jgi:hypothetical protein
MKIETLFIIIIVHTIVAGIFLGLSSSAWMSSVRSTFEVLKKNYNSFEVHRASP